MEISTLLVLTDFLMPGMNGDELILKLRENFADVNVVMLTGHITPEISERIMQQKLVLQVIHKPWKETELFHIIDDLANA